MSLPVPVWSAYWVQRGECWPFVRKLCSWCRTQFDGGPPVQPHEPVTHGMCKKCRAVALAKLQATQATSVGVALEAARGIPRPSLAPLAGALKS